MDTTTPELPDGQTDPAAPARFHPEIEELSTAINKRFLEEIAALQAHGFVDSIQQLSRDLGIGRNVITEIREGRRNARLAHIRRLKDVYNADYHYILFGVEEPDPERRGKYRAASGSKPRATLIKEIEAWMRYRFVKEMERMAREGRVLNKMWIGEMLHASRHIINSSRQGKGSVQAYWVPILKRELNADYHFIMWGFERPEISLPHKTLHGQRIRLDVFPKRPLSYPDEPKWGEYIKDRRPDDEKVRHESSYYLDLKSLKDQ